MLPVKNEKSFSYAVAIVSHRDDGAPFPFSFKVTDLGLKSRQGYNVTVSQKQTYNFQNQEINTNFRFFGSFIRIYMIQRNNWISHIQTMKLMYELFQQVSSFIILIVIIFALQIINKNFFWFFSGVVFYKFTVI